MHPVPNEQGSNVAQSILQRPHKVHHSAYPQQPNGSASRKDASLSNNKSTSSKPAKRAMTWSTLAALTMQVSLQDWVLIGAMIFGGCCSNVFALEILVNDAPKSGSTSTTQPPTSNGLWRYIPHLKERKIPLTRWLAIVVMFFAASVLNNLSLAYKISVPLHIIFRSGGLMVGMVLGMLIMKKRYSASQIFAVTIVTIGVIYATTSAKTNNSSKTPPSKTAGGGGGVSTGDYAMGVMMLTIAMIISSLLGLLQEATYQKYGSEWREGLFYSHFLALPMFLVFHEDIMTQFRIFNRSTPIPLLQLVRQVAPYLPSKLSYYLSSITIPRLWIFLAVNTLTQFMCISGVHRLTSLSSALTLNFVLNLRKFTSLLISVLYFDNSFGFEMAVGSSLVLLGTIMYSVSSSRPKTITAKDGTGTEQKTSEAINVKKDL
ncbi:golgi uridine diphosphate-N- acetylglucosamine transporter [Podila minutissima]|nr:golgi uridine diphosphate-N- acetylglucosamine transporter [Podila minutissima]